MDLPLDIDAGGGGELLGGMGLEGGFGIGDHVGESSWFVVLRSWLGRPVAVN